MRPYILSAAFLGALALTAGQQGAMAQATNLDTAAIEEAIGLKGQLIKEENVFKVSKPRTDVKVAVDQWTMPPFMGLGSWAAFTPAHGGAMLMGDTVVFEDEINPAMSVAFSAGLEVTALHNHFFFDEPKVFFMHIGGHGDAKALAAGVKKVYDKIAEIRVANPSPAKSYRFAQLDYQRSIGSGTRSQGPVQPGHVQDCDRPYGIDARRLRRQGNGHQHMGIVRRQ
jgi:Domain of Unknown Function (DUF1259)